MLCRSALIFITFLWEPESIIIFTCRYGNEYLNYMYGISSQDLFNLIVKIHKSGISFVWNWLNELGISKSSHLHSYSGDSVHFPTLVFCCTVVFDSLR